MATQGLNFQTHRFNDPTEGLQKALGAGSMFAQSLKSMQDFESEQAKLRMMQQEKDRQAKIDFEASQEKAKNIAASAALNDKSVKMDFGNEMYRGVTDQEKNAMTAKSDAELGIKSLSYADMLKGVDTSKWDKDQLAERDQWLAADSDKTAQYTAGNKLAVQKRLNMLNGMGNDEAEKAAAAALGLKDDQAKSILAGDTLQETFGQRVLETANSPLYMQSDAQALRDFKKKYGTTAQIEASIGSADKAESMARKELHDQIELKKQQAAKGIGDAEKDQLNREIQMLQLQAQNIGGPLERASYKESAGGGSKGKTPEQEYADTLARYLNSNKYAPTPVRDEMIKLARDMQIAGKSPDQIGAALAGSVVVTKGSKDNPDLYEFRRSDLANVAADADYWAKKRGSDSETTMYAQAAQEKQKLTDKMTALIGKKGKGSELEIANLQRQIAELERTPMQSAKDAAYQAGLDFAKDYNIGGYGDKQAAAATLQEKLANGGSGSGTGAAGTKTSDAALQSKLYGGELESEIKGRNAKQARLSTFQLPQGFNTLDKKQQASTIQDLSFSVIDQKEGTKKDPYKPYNDSLGKPTVGTGVLVAGLNKYLGHAYNPKNNADREALDVYQVKVKQDALNAGYKQAAELGFSADAIPILASVNYQLGTGWKDEFKESYALLKKGEYDKAIANLRSSKWNDQTKNRVEDFVAVIEQQKSFKARGMLNGVQEYYKKQSQPVVNLQQSIADASKKQDTYASKTPIQFMTQAEKTIYSNPNSRWIDKHNAYSSAEDRLSDYQSGIANRQRSLQLSSERQASTPAAKLQSVLTKTGYEAAYKQATPAEKLRIQAEALRKYNEMDNAAALQNLVNNRY